MSSRPSSGELAGIRFRRIKLRVAGDHLDSIVRQAMREGDLLAARAYTVAYAFLFRCRSEFCGT